MAQSQYDTIGCCEHVSWSRLPKFQGNGVESLEPCHTFFAFLTLHSVPSLKASRQITATKLEV